MDRRAARRYEFPVLVAIIGVLAFLLLDRLDGARAGFEDAAMQSEAAALRVELLDRLAHHQAVGGRLPDSRNPVVWAGRAPENYLGERDAAPADGGVWYFDTRRQELAYRYRSGREARFRLVRGAEAAGAQGSLGGIGLLRVDIPKKFQ
ncbi:hypothetical protein [Propionivibrio sp.]|uniref:hypothetical protein n=1 Tax=Propionivibrio sp. TaxID=2212460 RepID=UPI0039E6D451